MSIRSGELTFRIATEQDYDFLYDLHIRAMKSYIEQTWGWDEQVQQQMFRAGFDPSISRIIVVDQHDAGVLSVITEDEVFIRNIELLPEYQAKGSGTRILEDVISAAEDSGKPVALRVLKVSPARRLYERLGFIACGETESHHLMRRE